MLDSHTIRLIAILLVLGIIASHSMVLYASGENSLRHVSLRPRLSIILQEGIPDERWAWLRHRISCSLLDALWRHDDASSHTEIDDQWEVSAARELAMCPQTSSFVKAY